MANGFSIFLLKGFFDSLPQELYEAAEIDGAGRPSYVIIPCSIVGAEEIYPIVGSSSTLARRTISPSSVRWLRTLPVR